MTENTMMTFLTIGIILLAVSCICLAIGMSGLRKKAGDDQSLKNIQYIQQYLNNIQQNINSSFTSLGDILTGAQRHAAEIQDKRLEELNIQLTQRSDTLQKTVNDTLSQIEARLKTYALESEQKLEQIRNTMEKRISAMQEENSRKLDEMRATVDEKLQKTLRTGSASPSSLSAISWSRCTRDWARCRISPQA